MESNIKTNSNLLLKKIENIVNNQETIKKTKIKMSLCEFCNKYFEMSYTYYNQEKKNNKIIIKECDIHKLKDHNIINEKLYNKIFNFILPNIDYCLINTNGINIIDGLYEDGSYKKYIENNKNLFTTKVNRFSEHSGFIHFKDNKIDKITVLNNSRVDKNDPTIYMPKNSIEALEVNYIYHTHPKTPYIGSRAEDGIIYEFPSISDILHFIEHHNSGKLLGSLIIAPEGIYIIHKYNFNRDKIKIDYDIMIKDLKKIYSICYNESLDKYKDIDSYKKDNHIKIPDKLFYEKISLNFEYIANINKVLIRYDIYIDYYPRIKLNNINAINNVPLKYDRVTKQSLPKDLSDENYWIFPDIYVPIIL